MEELPQGKEKHISRKNGRLRDIVEKTALVA